jgi:nucleoid-associated protein YgaU
MKTGKKYVLKNKKRFFSVIIIVLIVMFTAIFSDISYGFNESSYELYTVKSGDTLWDIAKQYYDNGDIRKQVYKIKALNKFKSSVLITGQQIKLPAR